MKKYLLTLLILVIASPVFAVSSESFDKSKSKNPVIEKTVLNVSTIRAQIDATNSKFNSATRVCESAVGNLAKILLNENSFNKANGNIDAELIELNKYLKSQKSIEDFQNLTVSQKVSIRKDINILSSTQTSFSQLNEQTKKLVSNIKSDDFFALSFKVDLNNLVKIQANSTKLNKNITKLLFNLDNVSANSGISLVN